MPGIVGIIGSGKNVNQYENDFKNMLKSLIYNNDDLMKIIKDKNHFLGVVNIDDGRGIAKYFMNHDGSIESLIDGDVFIGNEIKQQIVKRYALSLTTHWQDFVPYLYETFGISFVKHLKGWFNLLIYDKRERSYYLANSRFGMRPLYYAIVNGYFIFASELKSIIKCSLIKKEINEKAVVDFALFNYPLGEDTYIQDVFLLDPATYVSLANRKMVKNSYWKQESLFSNTLLSVQESFENADVILKNAVNLMHENSKRVAVSITGGFDCRTILSLIDKQKENVYLYSFGKSTSPDIIIPTKISTLLSYNYTPIYLDDQYANVFFNDYAKKTVLYSDGRSSLARAHYLYASNLLRKKVKVILTGNCGSELIRPVHLTGEVVSNSIKLLIANNTSKTISQILNDLNLLHYYDKAFSNKSRILLHTSLKDIYKINYTHLKLNQRFYLFLLKEAFRKYFGTEISMESPYLYNRSPYLDYDFVSFIFKTPFCGANYDFFVRNPLVRIHGQQFYSYIINKNSKLLAKMNTNRMYAPYDLLTTTGKIKAGIAYCYRKFFSEAHDEYNLMLGLKNLLFLNRRSLKDNRFINAKNIINDYNNGNWRKHRIEFYKALSFAIWYYHNFG